MMSGIKQSGTIHFYCGVRGHGGMLDVGSTPAGSARDPVDKTALEPSILAGSLTALEIYSKLNEPPLF